MHCWTQNSYNNSTLHQQSPAKRFKTNETVQHDEPTVQSSSLNRESMNEILESQRQLSANLTISTGSLASLFGCDNTITINTLNLFLK